MQILALYLLNVPAGLRFLRYVHIGSRHLVLAGSLFLGMNSKVLISIKPSIYVCCASMNLFSLTCLFICA
jgi:hypothetical protein